MGIGCGSGNIYFGPDPLRVGTRVLNSLPDPTLMTLYLQVWPNATNNWLSWSYGEPYLINLCFLVSSGIGAEVKIVLGRIVDLLTGKSIGESSFCVGVI